MRTLRYVIADVFTDTRLAGNQLAVFTDPFPGGAALCAALGVEGSELPIELYDNGASHVFVALGSERQVSALQPTWLRSSRSASRA